MQVGKVFFKKKHAKNGGKKRISNLRFFFFIGQGDGFFGGGHSVGGHASPCLGCESVCVSVWDPWMISIRVSDCQDAVVM